MLEAAAHFSPCGRYRYTLQRSWDAGGPAVLFVGLNPSTADAERNDPTIRRCIGYAKNWGFGRLVVANLFALRATDPRDLLAASEPVGPENDRWLAKCQAEADLVVAAWGNHGVHLGRSAAVLRELKNPHCLRINASGEPAHPLYLPGDLAPFPLPETG